MLFKKKLLVICLFSLICLIPNAAFAESAITVSIDGSQLALDVSPVIDNGRILVPVRAIFEGLGMTVYFDGATNTITGSGKGDVITLQLDNTQAYVGSKAVTLDVPAKSVSGRTLVPIRFVAENCGANVVWDGARKAVLITTKSAAAPSSSVFDTSGPTGSVSYDDKEKLFMAQYKTIRSGNNVIEHVYISIYPDDDDPDVLVLAFLLAPESFDPFLKFRDSDEAYMLQIYSGIAKNLAAYYQKDVVFFVVYYNTYYVYPEQFKDNKLYTDTITDQGNDRWLVFYPMLEIDVDKDTPKAYDYWWAY